MIAPLKFAFNLLRLHQGANLPQLDVRPGDHNKPYKGKKIPLSVTSSCTYHCNLHCLHCQAENEGSRTDVDTGRFLDLIDEIASSGAVKIGFTGGEPLVRKDMGGILRRSYENGLVTTLVSNGLLVPKHIDNLKGLDLLYLSLDGDRRVHDHIRGRGNFDKFLEAVTIARANNIPIAALTTLNAMNYAVIKGLSSIVSEQEIHWLVGMIQVGFTGRSEQGLSKDQISGIAKGFHKVKNIRTSRKYLDFVRGARPMPKCFAGIGYCIIDPGGKLYPCFPAQFDKDYEGTSILDKSFKEAFQEMPLYRKTCDTCTLACHIETNYLYLFGIENIIHSYKLMRPVR